MNLVVFMSLERSTANRLSKTVKNELFLEKSPKLSIF